VASGGEIVVEEGATLWVNGIDVGAALAALMKQA
jgi:hypothetical protein